VRSITRADREETIDLKFWGYLTFKLRLRVDPISTEFPAPDVALYVFMNMNASAPLGPASCPVR
jgi:hypothetical protein